MIDGSRDSFPIPAEVQIDRVKMVRVNLPHVRGKQVNLKTGLSLILANSRTSAYRLEDLSPGRLIAWKTYRLEIIDAVEGNKRAKVKASREPTRNHYEFV